MDQWVAVFILLSEWTDPFIFHVDADDYKEAYQMALDELGMDHDEVKQLEEGGFATLKVQRVME